MSSGTCERDNSGQNRSATHPWPSSYQITNKGHCEMRQPACCNWRRRVQSLRNPPASQRAAMCMMQCPNCTSTVVPALHSARPCTSASAVDVFRAPLGSLRLPLARVHRARTAPTVNMEIYLGKVHVSHVKSGGTLMKSVWIGAKHAHKGAIPIAQGKQFARHVQQATTRTMSSSSCANVQRRTRQRAASQTSLASCAHAPLTLL